MKLRESIPVRTQISILPVITLVGFILVLILQYGGLSNQAKINEITLDGLRLTDSLRAFQQQLTTLRITEKNFFATGKIEYSKKHEQALQALLFTINNIQTNQNPIIDARHFQQWKSMLRRYQSVYLDATNVRETIGFSENVGLRGSMRNAIHGVEARITSKNTILMRDMLQIRRHEKDFIIRGAEKYYRQWVASIETFRQSVRAAELSDIDQMTISSETALYVNSFLKLAALQRHLATRLIKSDATSSEIVRGVGFAFTKASVYTREQIQAHYYGSQSKFRNIAFLTFVIATIAVITSRWIGGGIQSSFTLITTAMTGLAHRDVNTRIPATSYTNEIGEMANALRFFRENEKQRLLFEINLKKAKKQTDNIVKTMYESLFEIDAHGVIHSTNPAAANLLGASEEAIKGQNISKFFTQSAGAESTKTPEEFISNLLSRKSKAPEELQMLNACGEIVAVACSCGLLSGKNNHKTGAILTIQDITERKAAERAKSEFLSTVSHELRTPLTSIMGALRVIDSGALGDLSDKLQKMISIALSNSNRLATLINDILDFEKIEAGKMEFHLEPMDLSKLVKESLDANEGYAATYGIRFNARGIDRPIMVNGDKIRLMQVMSNLMSNAAKFSNKGGTVIVSLDRADTHVRVCVKDTGTGIPKAAQKTIFNRFTQADSSDQRKKGGTGLGLNIVKNLVAGHGGNIAFDSVEGQGTTFYFDLETITETAHNPTEQNEKSRISKSNNNAEDLRPCERGSAECIAAVRNPDEPDLADNARTAPLN